MNKENIDHGFVLPIVCNYYGVKKEAFLSKSRLGDVVVARKIYMYLLWDIFNYTHERIGSETNRNVSTVTITLKKVKSERSIYKQIHNDIEKLKENINKQLVYNDIIINNVNLLQMSINHTNSFA